MNENKYTILLIMPEGRWNQLNQCMFSDLLYDSRVIVLNSKFSQINSKLGQLARRIHFSHKINNIINLPFKELWKYTLDEISFEKNKKYVLIFPDSVYPITTKYLKKLKEHFDVTCILFLLNAQSEEQIKYTKPYDMYMDYVFTFDYSDARKYGYIECNNLYSKIISSDGEPIVKDMYYIGMDKGRIKTIDRIAKLSDKNDVKSLIRVMGVDADTCKNHDTNNVIFNQWISYNESLKEVLASNCILELLSAGQSGATLRYYEAVCYNKKLLTNNKNVVNLPFYNSDYIHVFEKPEDIDWDWVKERISVDYHYDGRFSPTHLIDKIIELEEQKEAQAGGEEK